MSNNKDTTDMTHEPPRRATPRLRFPEFQNAGAWEGKTLDSLLDYQQPTEYLVSDTNYSDVHNTPVLTAGKTFILGYTNEQHGIFSEGLPVIIFDDFTTATQFVDFPFKVKSSAMKILQAREGVHIKFMYETLQIISYEVGAHQRHWISKFAPMSVLVPSPKEQQRIADCLASLDELIAAHNAKLDALKAHKSGLLQQLFPAEGETVPRLRFPEFQNAGAWEEKRLGEISEIRTGPFGSVLHESDYVDIGTPIITVEHLDELGIKGKDFPRVSDLDKVRLSAYQLQEGDIVFSRVGSVDRSSIVGANEDGWLFSGRLLRLRMRKPKENSPQFLNQLLKHESSKAKIRNRAVGQTMPSLNTEILNGISFHLPSLIEEQRRIADCLASLDDLITAHSAKLDALRAHKKGLMQQLFPSADEVQG